MGKRELDEEAQEELGSASFSGLAAERKHLQDLVEALTGASDHKLRAVRYFLDEHASGSTPGTNPLHR